VKAENLKAIVDAQPIERDLPAVLPLHRSRSFTVGCRSIAAPSPIHPSAAVAIRIALNCSSGDLSSNRPHLVQVWDIGGESADRCVTTLHAHAGRVTALQRIGDKIFSCGAGYCAVKSLLIDCAL
jgi:hypothetical protein